MIKDQLVVEYDFTDALLLPRIGIFDSKRLHIVTVGMVNCFIFSLVSGLSIGLVVHKLHASTFSSIAVGAILALVFGGSSLPLSKRYVRAVEAKDDFVKGS